jgi:3-methyladenine DNA glycosylase AlkD
VTTATAAGTRDIDDADDPTHPSATPADRDGPSATTTRAVAFVAAHRPEAEALGTRLAESIQDPEAYAAVLRSGLAALADREYLAGQQFVAPGLGPTHGVRWPLLAAVVRGFRRETRHDRPAALLFIADRLFRERELDARWFAFSLLEDTLAVDPERTWQLLRRAARESADWITVDSLAHPYATGIAAEPFRWAELEQLVYSPSRWERRLVGSTIATMTHGQRRSDRGPAIVGEALPLLALLMGDAEPDVQKALSWAYRSLAQIDRPATTGALRTQADLAATANDGHRAWVVRDALSKLDPADADVMRTRLAGIRKRPGAGPTSEAAATASRFGALPDPATHPEPPLA